MSATQLAATYPVTRQAVVKHLGAMAEAGVVASTRHGREVRYDIVAGELDAAAQWIADVGAQWDKRLSALQNHFARKH